MSRDAPTRRRRSSTHCPSRSLVLSAHKKHPPQARSLRSPRLRPQPRCRGRNLAAAAATSLHRQQPPYLLRGVLPVRGTGTEELGAGRLNVCVPLNRSLRVCVYYCRRSPLRVCVCLLLQDRGKGTDSSLNSLRKCPPPPPRILNFGQGSVVDTRGVF
jgi:hypothetical protein